jgi:D-alanine-D-alanine ligase
MRIGLTYDLRSEHLALGVPLEQAAEFDEEATIAALEQTLRALGHDTDRIGHARALCERLVKGDRWDLVFNIAEGLRGRAREAQVPCLLDVYAIPYTFSDPLVCALTLDKAMTKRVLRSAGLATADFWVVREPADLAAVPPAFPLFAKPLAEGTGKGIDEQSRIADAAALETVCRRLLERFGQPVLVETYLPGREFTVGVLGTAGRARVAGLMEVSIRPGAKVSTYSLHAKEECEKWIDYTLPAPGRLRDEVERLALDSYRCLECRDAGRVDIRLDAAGRPCFLEVNPLPGLHPTHSDLPILCTMNGLPYPDLIAAIVASARDRVAAEAV